MSFNQNHQQHNQPQSHPQQHEQQPAEITHKKHQTIRQPSAQPAVPSSKLPAFLRNRLDFDIPAADGNIGDYRSNSAPPTQIIDHNEIYVRSPHLQCTNSDMNDPRAKPEYAAYFYTNSRLDPRLPPPIYAPGQSWQMWSSGVGSNSNTNLDSDWGYNNRLPIGENTRNSIQYHNNSTFSHSPASGPGYPMPQRSPPGSPGRRKNLVDMIQEDFPRTPSPVFGMNIMKKDGSRQSLVHMAVSNSSTDAYSDEIFNSRITSKTPPPPSLDNMSHQQQHPPRSSSTPPVMQAKSRMPIENPFVPSRDPYQPSNYADRITEAMSSMYLPDDENSFPGLETEYQDTSNARRKNSFQYQPSVSNGLQQPYGYPDAYSPGQAVPPSTWTGTALRRASHGAPDYGSAPVSRSSRVNLSLNNGIVPPEVNVAYGSRHSQPSPRHGTFNSVSTIGSSASFNSRSSKQDVGPSGRSAVLDEFRNCKNNKKFDLKDILGYVVEFSTDQHGSRFIQQKLESSDEEEKALIFTEIIPNAIQLMTDVFGNYVIQKFFEFGDGYQRHELALKVKGNVLTLALQMYGCRVVQKAFEFVDMPLKIELVSELKGNVLQCVKDQNGNHVIQKAIEMLAFDDISFIVGAFRGQVKELATHPYGCRVMQRIFEHCSEEQTEVLMVELRQYADSLVQDQYGNYVIQHVLEKGKPEDRRMVKNIVKTQILHLSKHKFASNVVEKCISSSNHEDRQFIIEEIVKIKADGTTPLLQMTKDQFANYVIQKMLDVSDNTQRELLISRIKPHFPSLRKFTYGKHIISKIEKLSKMGQNLIRQIEVQVAEGETSIDLSGKSISVIPEDICKLDMIQRLAFGNNQLFQLPPEMSQLKCLRYLNIKGNSFKVFPGILYNCEALEILDLSRNKIEELPEDLHKMKNLKVLSIAKNRVRRLPSCISVMDELKVLKLEGNPIEYPSKDILSWRSDENLETWLISLKNYLKLEDNELNRNDILKSDIPKTAESLISSKSPSFNVECEEFLRSITSTKSDNIQRLAFIPTHEAAINATYSFYRLFELVTTLHDNLPEYNRSEISACLTHLKQNINDISALIRLSENDVNSSILLPGIKHAKSLLSMVRTVSHLVFNNIDVRLGKEATMSLYLCCLSIRDSCEILSSQMVNDFTAVNDQYVPSSAQNQPVPSRNAEYEKLSVIIRFSEDAVINSTNAINFLEKAVRVHPTLKGKQRSDFQYAVSAASTSNESLRKILASVSQKFSFPISASNIKYEVNSFLTKSTKLAHEFKTISNNHRFGRDLISLMQIFTRSIKNLAMVMKS